MRIPVLLGLVALGIVYYFALKLLPPTIETELQARASETLHADQRDWASVDVDGRDLYLSGSAPSEGDLDATKTALEDIQGVRTVFITTDDEQAPAKQQLAIAPIDLKTNKEPVSKNELIIPKIDDALDAKPDIEPVPASMNKRTIENCKQQLSALQASDKIRFKVNTSYVLPSSVPLLEQLSKIAKSCGDEQLMIGGHTDSLGSDAINRKLSRLRAETVRSFLVSKGVNENQLEANGHGSTKPIAKNDTAKGRAQNRRIEITVGG